MAHNAEATTVTPSQLSRIITVCLTALRPLMIWGAPAVGKSSIVRQVADLFLNTDGVLHPDSYFIDIRAMLLDPVDLRGVPFVRDGITRWAPPCFLPVVGSPVAGGHCVFNSKGIIFIDELSQCDASVQSALLQLILDRKLGEYVLPDGWRIVAAGNRIADGTFSKKMSKALGSRFVTHVDLGVSNRDWEKWAVDNSIAHEVLAFLRFRPEMLHMFDPKAEGNSFPSPRTWAFVSEFVGKLDNDIQLPFLAGSLGAGPASEFVGFLRLYKDLPDIDEVLINPTGAPLPQEPASQYALCGALARKTTAQSATAAFKYMGRLSVEMQVVWLRDTLRLSTEVAKTKEFTDWAIKNGELLS